MAGEEEKEEQAFSWMEEKAEAPEPEQPQTPAPQPAPEVPAAREPAPVRVPAAPEEVIGEEPRMLAPAARPRARRTLRGAFVGLISLVILGMALLVLTFVVKIVPVGISLTVFMPIAGLTVGGIAGILLGDLVVQPSALSRFIAILVAGLIGYASSAVGGAIQAGRVTELVGGFASVMTLDNIVVWLVFALMVIGLALGFLLGFVYAARPKE